MNLQPLEDRLVVRQAEAEETTASGLIIPDTAKEKPQQGEVLAVGPGRRSDTGDLIPVDVKYGGTEITVEGEDLLILQARDVLATVK
jgi:chaperonin GroES